MKHHSLAFCAASVCVLVAGCTKPSLLPADGQNPDVITLVEAQTFKSGNAYDVIRKLRPTFLTYRGPSTILGTASSMPTVYVDGMRYGTIATLREIPAAWIAEVRMYRTASAARFGVNNSAGVLAITTRKH